MNFACGFRQWALGAVWGTRVGSVREIRQTLLASKVTPRSETKSSMVRAPAPELSLSNQFSLSNSRPIARAFWSPTSHLPH